MYREHETQPLSPGHETVVLDPAAHETLIFPHPAASQPTVKRRSLLRGAGVVAGALLLVATGAAGGALVVSANSVAVDEASARIEVAQQRGYEDGFEAGTAEASKNAAAQADQSYREGYRDGYQAGVKDGVQSALPPAPPQP